MPTNAEAKKAIDAKDGPEKTFELIGGPHRDADGDHEAGTDTRFVKSTKDLVAIHGSEKFKPADQRQPFTPSPPIDTEKADADKKAAEEAAKNKK